MPNKRLFFSIVALVLLSACASQNGNQKPLSPNVPAHDFALADQDGNTVRLSDVLQEYRGAVIAFYPKDDTRY